MTTFRRFLPSLPLRRLDTHLAVTFGLTAVLALLAIMLYVNSEVVRILNNASQAILTRVTNESRTSVDNRLSRVDMLAKLFASDPDAMQYDTASQRAFIQRIRVVLDATPIVSAVYLGYDNGSFVLLRRLTSKVARDALRAPDEARYMLEIVTPKSSHGTAVALLDDTLSMVGTASYDAASYDPRTRDWYAQARRSNDAILTDPYRSFMTGERGVTLARALSSGHGVVGFDVGLVDLSHDLLHMKTTPSTEVLILNEHGAVVASSDPAVESAHATRGASGASVGSDPSVSSDAAVTSSSNARSSHPDAASDSADPTQPLPAIIPIMRKAAQAPSNATAFSHVTVDGRAWSLRVAPLATEPWALRIAIAAPNDEILTHARHLLTTLAWIGVGLVVAVVLGIRATARAVSRPLEAIAQEAGAIHSFYFDEAPERTRSSVVEIDTLSDAIRKARLTIQRFVEIGRALSAEHDPDRLMDRLLQETITITGAESGLILLTEDQGATFSVVTRHHGTQTADTAKPNDDATGSMSPGAPSSSANALGTHVTDALLKKTVSHFDANEPDLHPVLAGLVGESQPAPGEILRFSVLPLLNRAGETVGGMVL
ncbi:MAG TPA: cache domain-containing protein, partial [Pararobbsia sp.]|nr:cache domain-containing protein [Pararobbsia sp.]